VADDRGMVRKSHGVCVTYPYENLTRDHSEVRPFYPFYPQISTSIPVSGMIRKGRAGGGQFWSVGCRRSADELVRL